MTNKRARSRLAFTLMGMAAGVLLFGGTALAQSSDLARELETEQWSRPLTAQEKAELLAEEEMIAQLDLPGNPAYQRSLRTASALDRAFGYVWEGRLEARMWNFGMTGALGISSEYYEHGIPGAARSRDRFLVRTSIALGVEEGPWWPNAQVHENTGYYDGTGGDTYVSMSEWEARDGQRGEAFADPPATRFDTPLMAIASLQSTWPASGWPAPEDVEDVWLGTEMWNKWARKSGDEFYGEFDDAQATRRGTGENSVLDISGRVRVVGYGSNDAAFYQFELTNNSSWTYTDVYVGHWQRRRLLVSDGNDMFPRWDDARQMTYCVGPEYFGGHTNGGPPWDNSLNSLTQFYGVGTHVDDDGDPAPWGGFVYLQSPTGSFKTDALGNLADNPDQVITRVALSRYGDRIRDGDHEWGKYGAMSGEPEYIDDGTTLEDIWKMTTIGGGTPVLKQDEFTWAQYVYGEPAMNDSLTEINETSFQYISSGPFDMAPGESIDFVYALVAGPTEPQMLANADKAIRSFQAQLEASGPPPSPVINASGGEMSGPAGRDYDPRIHAYPVHYVPEGGITLTWEGADIETYRDPITLNRDFQGYKIYRSIDRGSTWGDRITDENVFFKAWKPVVQFDLVDGIQGLDPATYTSLGTDSGLQHSWTDVDAIPGVEYWYAITSYDYDPLQDVDFPSFEGAIGSNPNATNVIAVIAGARPNGYVPGSVQDLSGELASSLDVTPSAGPYVDGIVSVNVLDERAVKDATYRVSFTDTAVYGGMSTQTNTLGVTLTNLTSGDVLYTSALPQDADYGSDLLPMAEGLKLVVDSRWIGLEDPYDRFSESYPTGFEEDSSTRFAVDYWDGVDVYDINQAGLAFTAEMRFDTTATQTAYVYWRENVSGTYDYLYKGMAEFPGTVWDVSDPTSPRQVDIAYSVNESDGTNGDAWDIENDIHRTHILRTDYSGDAPLDELTTGARNSMTTHGDWAVYWMQPELDTDYFPRYQDLTGEVVTLGYVRPVSPQNEYEFTTTAPVIDEELVDMDEIVVTPNPYYLFATWDQNENNRKIQFRNVPTNSTVDIYTLAGELVASLSHRENDYHSDAIGTVEWNIWTYEYTEAAYGLYIYVVKTDDGRKKVGKFAIIR